MNTVYRRQNEDTALTYQALARYYYNKADRYDLIHWIAIIVTLLLKFIWTTAVWVDIVLIGLFLLSYLIEYYITEWTLTGAKLKGKFDSYVLGLTDDISNNPLEKNKWLIEKKINWFEEQKQNTGSDNPKGVKDWYNVSEVTNANEAKKISIRENLYYDNKINNILFLTLLSLLLISIFIFLNSTVLDFLSTLFLAMATLTDKIIRTKTKLFQANKINSQIELELKNANTRDDYSKIVGLLTNKRQIEGISPNTIYKIANIFKLF